MMLRNKFVVVNGKGEDSADTLHENLFWRVRSSRKKNNEKKLGNGIRKRKDVLRKEKTR